MLKFVGTALINGVMGRRIIKKDWKDNVKLEII
jgi:hypothetical protein